MNALSPEPILIARMLEPRAQTALAEATAQAAEAAEVEIDAATLSMLWDGRSALHVVQASRLATAFSQSSSRLGSLDTEGRLSALQDIINEDGTASKPIEVMVTDTDVRPIGEGLIYFYTLSALQLIPQHGRITTRIDRKNNTATFWGEPNRQLGIGSQKKDKEDKGRKGRMLWAFREVQPKESVMLLGARAMRASDLLGADLPVKN